MKPFVIARKNFLFANTANGAEGSSIIFCLIDTVKENTLDPYRYLTHVLGLAPNLDESNPDWAESHFRKMHPSIAMRITERNNFLI